MWTCKPSCGASSATMAQISSSWAKMALPFPLAVARTSNGQPIVVAGADFDRVRQLDRWWSVSNWPSAPQQALVGVRALSVVSPKSQPFDLEFQGHTIHLTP